MFAQCSNHPREYTWIHKFGNWPDDNVPHATYLLKPNALTKLFQTFAQWYADRLGYTQIHRFGNWPIDNALHTILELVDSPRDLLWEILKDKLKSKRPEVIINMQGCSHHHPWVKTIKLHDAKPFFVQTTWTLLGLYSDFTRTLLGLYSDSTRTLLGLYLDW